MTLTIEHVASLAGVSRSTVSRVLNNHSGVAPDVRERVLQVIREHNYVPQAAARSLASARTNTIGLVIPRSAAVTLADPYIALMISAISEASVQQGYFLLLAMLTADIEPGFYDHMLRGRHFDGVIMFSIDIDDPILPLLIKDGGPLVLIGRHPYFRNVTSVDVENHEGAHEAVAHLVALGHRRIGLVNGQLEMEAAQARSNGYKQALLEAGIPIETELMVEGRYSEAIALRSTLQLLDLEQPPTAIFTASDAMAFGALHAIQQRGLRVPEDVALVSFDDLPFAATSSPSISSVHQPVPAMGANAVRLVIEQMRGEGPVGSVILPAPLIVRESSGERVAASTFAKGGSALARK